MRWVSLRTIALFLQAHVRNTLLREPLVRHGSWCGWVLLEEIKLFIGSELSFHLISSIRAEKAILSETVWNSFIRVFVCTLELSDLIKVFVYSEPFGDINISAIRGLFIAFRLEVVHLSLVGLELNSWASSHCRLGFHRHAEFIYIVLCRCCVVESTEIMSVFSVEGLAHGLVASIRTLVTFTKMAWRYLVKHFILPVFLGLAVHCFIITAHTRERVDFNFLCLDFLVSHLIEVRC